MRLSKYINESQLRGVELDIFHDIWRKLEKDCAPFLKEIKRSTQGIFLYRGVKKRIENSKFIIPRRDRISKDTPDELHELLDDLFYKKFRWRPRSTGVFTTSHHSDAYNYGTVYLFFPTGKYKFVWSPETADLFSVIEGSEYIYDDPSGFEDDWYNDWEYEYGEGKEGTWYYDGTDTDYYDYGESRDYVKYEVLSNPDDFDESLMGWEPGQSEDEYIDNRRGEWEEERDRFFDNIIEEYTDRDLKSAIKSRNEITFRCDGYYLVDEKYRDVLIDYIWKGGYKQGR